MRRSFEEKGDAALGQTNLDALLAIENEIHIEQHGTKSTSIKLE